MLILVDVILGVPRGVSMEDVSICTSVAFNDAWSGVGGGVHALLGKGEGCRGESGGVLTQGLQRGFSISAEAMRVLLHGMLV